MLYLFPSTLEVLMSSRSWFIFIWISYLIGMTDNFSLILREKLAVFFILSTPKCFFSIIGGWTWFIVLWNFTNTFANIFGFRSMCPLYASTLDDVYLNLLIFVWRRIYHKSVSMLICITYAFIDGLLEVISWCLSLWVFERS